MKSNIIFALSLILGAVSFFAAISQFYSGQIWTGLGWIIAFGISIFFAKKGL